jgi:hypothetical protein
MTFVTAALISGGASIVGGLMAGQSAKKGAQIQADAMREAAAYEKQMFDVQNENQRPYREAGYSALGDIAGMKPYLTKQFGPEDFQAGIDPSYNFRLEQGNIAATNMANRSGGAIGGNALRGLVDFGQGLASTEYGNVFDRFQKQRGNIYNNLASIAGLGQTSLGQTGQLSSNTAQSVGGSIAGAGSAIGGGQIAAGNAYGSGLQGGGNAYMLSQMLNQRNPVTPTGGGMSLNYDVAPANYGLTQGNPSPGGAQGFGFRAS